MMPNKRYRWDFECDNNSTLTDHCVQLLTLFLVAAVLGTTSNGIKYSKRMEAFDTPTVAKIQEIVAQKVIHRNCFVLVLY